MVTHATSLNPAQLQFTDAASCAHWIESLPLTNVLSAQALLAQQLALVRNAGIAPAELLRILEALRVPVHYVQSELARKYTAKPLPLDANESAMWQRALGLWQELVDAYVACRDARERGDAALHGEGALIVQRCLRYTASMLFEHYRIYRQAPGAIWEDLHRQYAFAVAGGVAGYNGRRYYRRAECRLELPRCLLPGIARASGQSVRLVRTPDGISRALDRKMVGIGGACCAAAGALGDPGNQR